MDLGSTPGVKGTRKQGWAEGSQAEMPRASPMGALELELLSRVIPNGPFIPSNPSVIDLCCPGKGEILGEAAAYS